MGDLRAGEWAQVHELYFYCNHRFACPTVTLVDSWPTALTRFRYNLSRESLLPLARRIGRCNSVRMEARCHPRNSETACLLSFSYTFHIFFEILDYFRNTKISKHLSRYVVSSDSHPRCKHWDWIPSSLALFGKPWDIVTVFMRKEKEGKREQQDSLGCRLPAAPWTG